jgi:hypothetical protein
MGPTQVLIGDSLLILGELSKQRLLRKEPDTPPERVDLHSKATNGGKIEQKSYQRGKFTGL